MSHRNKVIAFNKYHNKLISFAVNNTNLSLKEIRWLVEMDNVARQIMREIGTPRLKRGRFLNSCSGMAMLFKEICDRIGLDGTIYVKMKNGELKHYFPVLHINGVTYDMDSYPMLQIREYDVANKYYSCEPQTCRPVIKDDIAGVTPNSHGINWIATARYVRRYVDKNPERFKWLKDNVPFQISPPSGLEKFRSVLRSWF